MRILAMLIFCVLVSHSACAQSVSKPTRLPLSQQYSGAWATESSIGFTHRASTAACVIDGRIYVLGGYDTTAYLNTMEVFDPALNSWSRPVTSGRFTPRRGLCVGVVNDKIYAIGGYDGVKALSTFEMFDPTTNAWSTPATSGTFTAREKLCCSVIGDKIYVMGGFNETVHLNKLEIFDAATSTWTTPVATGTFTARRGLAASVVQGKIFVLGGYDGNYLNIAEVFDPSTNIWSTPTTTGTFTARGAICSGVIDGKIYVLGGIHFVNPNYIDLNTVEVLDPITNAWSTPTTTGTFTARHEISGSILGNSIYVFGGRNGSGFLNLNERYTPTSLAVNNEARASSLVVSPNPATDFVTISQLPKDLISIAITNILGEVVEQFANPRTTTITLDLQKLKVGAYTIALTTSSGLISRKVLKY
jgi:N-acetylneuraminic acid mutarotase